MSGVSSSFFFVIVVSATFVLVVGFTRVRFALSNVV